MHRDKHVGLELPDLGDDLLEVVRRRRTEMEAADDCVHFLDAETSCACRTELTMPT